MKQQFVLGLVLLLVTGCSLSSGVALTPKVDVYTATAARTATRVQTATAMLVSTPSATFINTPMAPTSTHTPELTPTEIPLARLHAENFESTV